MARRILLINLTKPLKKKLLNNSPPKIFLKILNPSMPFLSLKSPSLMAKAITIIRGIKVPEILIN